MAARDSYGRLLALLAASTSDLAAAEDALADAFERALRTWPSHGVPASPDAWLLTVARNRLRDQWKSARAQRTLPLNAVPLEAGRDALAYIGDLDVDSIPDRRLELMLVCAHPAIERAVRTPLMLNTVLGFTAEQVGRAFSVPSSTMATRLVRAKKRIKAAGISFRIPDRADLPARMTSVLEAVYGAYVIDWATGPQARELPPEALHLAEVLTTLVPGDPEARGLAALIEFSAARAPARVDPGGRFVPLADQDPSLWNQHLMSRARVHLRAAHACGQLGRFQLEAAIQAVHCSPDHGAPDHGAPDHGDRGRDGTTDWPTLLTLHRILHAIAPSLGSGVALAAVTAEVDGPAAGLATLDALLEEAGQPARRFQPAKAARAHLLDRLGRKEEAVAAYESAISLTHDTAERQYLELRRGRASRQDPAVPGQRSSGDGAALDASLLPWLYDLRMTRVLLAEDDTSISEPLSRALRREGYQVEVTEDGPATLGRAMSDGIDLILLDIGLPELDGLEVCRRVRAEGNGVPVLILTARADEVDTVVGLDAGADDYVTKPFRLAELLARVRALLRRGTAEVPGTVRGVRVDAEARRAWHGDTELDLTTKEFDLLWILLRDAGKVVTREQIMREVWDAKWWTSTKTLDMHISWLRRKLGDDAHHPRYITTVRGVGFRFERGD